MKVSEHWLRTYIDTPVSITELADQLTNAGLEIDNLECIETDPKDFLLTLKIPPNRGDCLSMEGIARELAVLNQMHYQAPQTLGLIPKGNHQFPVRVEAPEACPRYVGRVIKDIDGSLVTPLWMQKRLQQADIRIISPVVDVTNYVMLELGQPLHAFDLKKLDTEIVVRFAKPGETIILLEGQEIKLEPDMLVIADKNKPLAIAGIMGGLDSSVTPATKTVFLESAFFNPINIRLTARHLGLRTESSYRFERTIDRELQSRALERATQLLLEIVGGTAGPIVEFYDDTHLPKNITVSLRRSKVQAILGVELNDKDIVELLSRLGMTLHLTDFGWEVVIPSFRADLLQEIDLIEEIARVFGYHRLPSENPVSHFVYDTLSENQISLDHCKKTLIDRGYFEAITYSFIDPKLLELFDSLSASISLMNPISSELQTMRTSLWPGLLQAVLYNQGRQQTRMRLFEAGLGFKNEDQKLEQKMLIAGVATGDLYPLQWGATARGVDFFDVKADIEALVKLSGRLEYLNCEASHHPALQPGQAATLLLGNKTLGVMGALHPKIIKALDLQEPVFVFELELATLQQSEIPKFQMLSKYPAVRRDIAVIVGQEVLANQLKSAIVECVWDLLQDVVVFDVYQGKGIELGKKSIALSLILQHPSRTLVEDEVNEVVEEVVALLVNRFQAVLRE